MPRPDLTDITVVLDRSGSMDSIKDDTIEAFNGFLTSQRQGTGTARISLVQFDDRYDVVYEAVTVDRAPALNEKTFQPRGSTALLDAMGRAIDVTGWRLQQMAEAERPGTVLFVTLTDGLENSSREFTMDRLNAMISHQRDKYAWEFVFLAANQDAIATAAQLGINRGHALTFAASPEGVAASMGAFDGHVHARRRHMAAGGAAAEAPIEFTPEERQKAGK